MAEGGDRPVIAERVFSAKHEPTDRDVPVTLRCYAPLQVDERGAYCDYEVLVDGKRLRIFRVFGVDTFQALLLSVGGLTADAALFLRREQLSFKASEIDDLERVNAALLAQPPSA